MAHIAGERMTEQTDGIRFRREGSAPGALRRSHRTAGSAPAACQRPASSLKPNTRRWQRQPAALQGLVVADQREGETSDDAIARIGPDLAKCLSSAWPRVEDAIPSARLAG